jgi:FAD/FMN-containing dehydrogenase
MFSNIPASAAARHKTKIARITAQIRAHKTGTPLSLKKAGVSHQVPKFGDLRHGDAKIDVSDLTEILWIDPDSRVCIAESGVAFVDLVAATMQHGLVPIVVPELKTITIGGAVAGCSIESMSFEHGGFHDTCLAYEVVTATGEPITTTPEDLTHQMVHGTFGVCGVVSLLAFKLVPAKKFVHLIHETYSTIEEYQAAIAQHAKLRDLDFMDGIIHSPTKFVLCTGHFVDTAPYTSNYEWMKVYWESTGTRTEDYLTTPDYFFRYDRGVTNVRPRSFVGRLIFGRFIASTEMLWLARKLSFLLPRTKPTITLDTFVPTSKVPEFLRWYDKTFEFYPLWCVPYRIVRRYEWLTDEYWAGVKDDMFLDLAIYGMKQKGDTNYHRLMEEKLKELGGIKTLIAHNYYSEDEFWTIWNKRNHDAVKAITDPHNLLRDLYSKMVKAAMGVK